MVDLRLGRGLGLIYLRKLHEDMRLGSDLRSKPC